MLSLPVQPSNDDASICHSLNGYLTYTLFIGRQWYRRAINHTRRLGGTLSNYLLAIGFIMRPLWVLLAGARALSAIKDRRDEGLVSGSSLITGKKVRHIKYDGLDLTGSYRAVKHMDNSGICTFEDHHYSGPIAPYNEEVRYK